jgi:hypothetical protein
MKYVLGWSKSSEPRAIYEIFSEVCEKLKRHFVACLSKSKTIFFKVFLNGKLFLWKKRFKKKHFFGNDDRFFFFIGKVFGLKDTFKINKK